MGSGELLCLRSSSNYNFLAFQLLVFLLQPRRGGAIRLILRPQRQSFECEQLISRSRDGLDCVQRRLDAISNAAGLDNISGSGRFHQAPPKLRKHPNQDFIQIDTSNILFICGGAFEGLVDIIKNRTGYQLLGFRADNKPKTPQNIGEILHTVLPEDLLRYGLIPELIGRLPVIATLEPLTEEALVRILIEPKNALIKQYKKLMSLDGAEVSFTHDALRAIAQKATERKTGARGLRAILESLMLDLMFELPSRKGIKKCIIDRHHIEKADEVPLVSYFEEEQPAEKRTRDALA